MACVVAHRCLPYKPKTSIPFAKQYTWCMKGIEKYFSARDQRHKQKHKLV
ncbi:hypothetical protein EXN66_Car002405 [Channa argus]|uniref:Uncharacterized protein n=1 Tax=Channa argus TaxID=215402 RepID=A0A6G1P960_CHAAH|nr:hypothetical protein EXN66_Car002405 [Channa argus]